MVFGDQTSCFQNGNQKPSKDGGGFIGLWQILTNFPPPGALETRTVFGLFTETSTSEAPNFWYWGQYYFVFLFIFRNEAKDAK